MISNCSDQYTYLPTYINLASLLSQYVQLLLLTHTIFNVEYTPYITIQIHMQEKFFKSIGFIVSTTFYMVTGPLTLIATNNKYIDL